MKLTLHEAMLRLFQECRRERMTCQEIANELNRNKWYEKKDKSLIPADQIKLRAMNYPQYFCLCETEVRLAGKDFPEAKETVPPTSIAESEVMTDSKNDEWEKVESQLMAEENFVSSVEGIQKASEKSGIYCIRIKDIQQLPLPCQEALVERKHNILYIGIATNLQRRLQQELEAMGHGTFFRSLGAILGFTPPQGSLTRKKNKKNYTFSPDDECKIIQFIREHLLINYVETSTRDEELETRLIGKYQPAINIDKNPGKLPFVQEKRALCVNIANKSDL